MQSVEEFFSCPYCGERISMILDLSVEAQSYIEDCEVCCRPIQITYEVASLEDPSLKNLRVSQINES